MEQNPVENQVEETPEQLQEKQRLALEELKRKIEEARLPLNESSSTDVIQRINAISNILKTTIHVPKFTQERVNGQNTERMTGSIEISVFPSFGDYDQQWQSWCYNHYSNMLGRLMELTAKL